MKSLPTIILVLSCLLAFAQSEEVRKKNYNVSKNIALGGYDPVSFFNNKPEEGKEDITFTYKGIAYRFVNAANQVKFKASPYKYEPAYGGWCAFAMGETGEKVKIDPETFKIIDGKLHLFYNFWGNNTLKDWNSNEKTLKAKADQNWRKLVPNP